MRQFWCKKKNNKYKDLSTMVKIATLTIPAICSKVFLKSSELKIQMNQIREDIKTGHKDIKLKNQENKNNL